MCIIIYTCHSNKILCIVLYCIVLYCIVLYCIVLYCIVLFIPNTMYCGESFQMTSLYLMKKAARKDYVQLMCLPLLNIV